jgi:hypothetical protein
VTVTVAGLGGQIRAVTRLRTLTFGTPQDPQVAADPDAASGDAAQSAGQTGR